MAKSINPAPPVGANAEDETPESNGQDVTVTFKFVGGVGKATVQHFSDDQVDPVTQQIDTSGDLTFSNVENGDVILVRGVCAGTANITLSVPTSPKNPKDYPAGPIRTLFVIK